jgi:predicted Fe-Mo cluster-binding NifX family protein
VKHSEVVDVKIAIPRMGETVAPCFEYSATIAVFTVEEGKLVDQIDCPITSREPLDRVRLLRDQAVDTIICGGVQDVFEDLLRASGIESITWVTGNVSDLLDDYVHGRLNPGGGGDRGVRFGRTFDKDKRAE